MKTSGRNANMNRKRGKHKIRITKKKQTNEDAIYNAPNASRYAYLQASLIQRVN